MSLSQHGATERPFITLPLVTEPGDMLAFEDSKWLRHIPPGSSSYGYPVTWVIVGKVYSERCGCSLRYSPIIPDICIVGANSDDGIICKSQGGMRQTTKVKTWEEFPLPISFSEGPLMHLAAGLSASCGGVAITGSSQTGGDLSYFRLASETQNVYVRWFVMGK